MESKHIKWDEQPLGSMSDIDLAKAIGVTPASVWQARTRRGIKRFKTKESANTKPSHIGQRTAANGFLCRAYFTAEEIAEIDSVRRFDEQRSECVRRLVIAGLVALS